MVVDNNQLLAEAAKGYLAFTLYLMGKSKYEIRQALIVLNDVLNDNNTLLDMIKYYRKLDFKD